MAKEKNMRISMERLDEMLGRGSNVAPGERITDGPGKNISEIKEKKQEQKRVDLNEELKRVQKEMEAQGPGMDASRSEEDARIDEYFAKLGKEMDFRKTDAMRFHINGQKVEMQRVPDLGSDEKELWRNTPLRINNVEVRELDEDHGKQAVPGKAYYDAKSRSIYISKEDYEEAKAMVKERLSQKSAPTFGKITTKSGLKMEYKNNGKYIMAVNGSRVDDSLLRAGVKKHVTGHTMTPKEILKDFGLDTCHEIKTGVGRHIGEELIHSPRAIAQSYNRAMEKNSASISKILGAIINMVERNSQIR